jgi:hypothetical protein
MKLENYRFPPLKENEVMFENSDIAPDWRDDKECFRCRQVFTTFIRKVNKNRILPRFLLIIYFSIIVEHVEIFFAINVHQNNVQFQNMEWIEMYVYVMHVMKN